MDSVPSESVRTPRFQRVTPPSFVLTARDFAILQAAATFGTIQSHQLERLIEGSSQQLRRRLKLLFNAGYLGRPRCQIARMINGEGSHAMAYTPTPKGAALLGLGGPRIVRSAEEGELYQLLHRLAVTDVLVDVTVACRQSQHLAFVPQEGVLAAAPAATQTERTPDCWPVSVRYRGASQTLYLQPDGLFAVRHRALFAAGKPSDKSFFLEVDEGTMPIVRPSLAQTSIVRKLLCYGATFRGGIHTSRFGMDNMRVLIVTKTAQRVAHMIEAYRAHAAHVAPPRLFLMIDRARLAEAANILQATWLDGEGKEQRLFG